MKSLAGSEETCNLNESAPIDSFPEEGNFFFVLFWRRTSDVLESPPLSGTCATTKNVVNAIFFVLCLRRTLDVPESPPLSGTCATKKNVVNAIFFYALLETYLTCARSTVIDPEITRSVSVSFQNFTHIFSIS